DACRRADRRRVRPARPGSSTCYVLAIANREPITFDDLLGTSPGVPWGRGLRLGLARSQGATHQRLQALPTDNTLPLRMGEWLGLQVARPDQDRALVARENARWNHRRFVGLLEIDDM